MAGGIEGGRKINNNNANESIWQLLKADGLLHTSFHVFFSVVYLIRSINGASKCFCRLSSFFSFTTYIHLNYISNTPFSLDASVF